MWRLLFSPSISATISTVKSSFRYFPILVMLLTACSSLSPTLFTPSTPTPEWQRHQQEVRQITRYSARGIFGYIAGTKRVSANFLWQQQDPQHYRLLLTNPLGGTELDLQVKPGLAELVDRKGQRYVDNDVENLLNRLTGMSIPLENLRTWIMGLPAEGDQIQLDNHLLQQLVTETGQQRWHIRYLAYHLQSKPAMPKQLELSRDELTIKLRIDSWILP